MIKLYNADCFEVLKTIPNESVDLIICDLPYGTTHHNWDNILPLDTLWKELKRIRKLKTPILAYANGKFMHKMFNSNINEYRYKWIWKKTCPTGFFDANRRPLKCFEEILVFNTGYDVVFNPQKTKGKAYTALAHCANSKVYGSKEMTTTINSGERYPKDIIEFNRDKKRYHPTQKPVKLSEYLIKTYTNAGAIVLDPTMGAGGVGVACVNTGRSFIGIEIDKNFFEIAKKRIENEN